ncbi:DUF1616 domain-containing protein [Natrialbaceae archaeon A-CW1-1]
MSLTTRTQNTVDAVFRYPSDLAIVSLTAVVAYWLVITLPSGSNIRLVAALAFVAFLPGYALVSVLFPVAARARAVGSQSMSENRPGGIDVVERVALGLGLSIAIVPMIVLVLPLTEWGLEIGSVVGALALVTLVLAQLGVIRRLRVPESDRFSVSLTAFRNRLSHAVGTGTTRASAVVLAITVIAAIGMLLYAFAAPMAAGGFTQLGIYTAHDDDELVADMPSTVAPGSEIPITFQIHNNEGQEMEYTLVMQEQVVEDGEVVERITHREVTVISRSTDAGQITAERTVTPVSEDGETVRIAVMLFEDDAPATPSMEDAMEYTYFWVTIETPPDAPGSADSDSTDEPGEEGGDETDDDSVDGDDDSAGTDDDTDTADDDDSDDTVSDDDDSDDSDDDDDSDDTDDADDTDDSDDSDDADDTDDSDDSDDADDTDDSDD